MLLAWETVRPSDGNELIDWMYKECDPDDESPWKKSRAADGERRRRQGEHHVRGDRTERPEQFARVQLERDRHHLHVVIKLSKLCNLRCEFGRCHNEEMQDAVEFRSATAGAPESEGPA